MDASQGKGSEIRLIVGGSTVWNAIIVHMNLLRQFQMKLCQVEWLTLISGCDLHQRIHG